LDSVGQRRARDTGGGDRGRRRRGRRRRPGRAERERRERVGRVELPERRRAAVRRLWGAGRASGTGAGGRDPPARGRVRRAGRRRPRGDRADSGGPGRRL